MTIYPFGTNGQLPSSVGIINDYITGGADKAASAEVAKTIASALMMATTIDYSSVSLESAVIGSSNGKWVLNYSTCKCRLIPVDANSVIRITANSNNSTSYAVLKTNTITNATTVDFATGYTTVRNIAAGGTESFVVPSDGAYLYILFTGESSVDRTPSSVESLELQSLSDALANLDANAMLAYNVPIRKRDTTNAYIGASNNKWAVDYQSLRGLFIPVAAGDTLKIASNSTSATTFAVLQNNTVNNGSVVSFALGESALRTVAASGTLDYTVPTGAHYIFVNWTSSFDENPFSVVRTTPISAGIINCLINTALIDGYAAMPVPLYYGGSADGYYTPLKVRVRKGDILYFSGNGSDTQTLVSFSETYNGTTTALVTGAVNGDNKTKVRFLSFVEDGYVRLFSSTLAPTAILYSKTLQHKDIVIAASNTSDAKKVHADYICTGTNDEVLLNAAFAAAGIFGRTVRLLQGDYYVDGHTKHYDADNDTFLLVDTSGSVSRGVTIIGEDAYNRPVIHVSNTAYEGLDSNTAYTLMGVYDSSTYGGWFKMENVRLRLPENQKKITALNLKKFGGYARLYSISAVGYTNGYNNQNISIGNPPTVAPEGCIGINFVGKGPNGAYGNDMTNVTVEGFNEGICINTEWALCTHCASIFCSYGWVFGKYGGNSPSSSATHPIMLLRCGDERNVNLPLFHDNGGKQDVEIYAFNIERSAAHAPGGVLGNLAVETTPGRFRGVIHYTTTQAGLGTKGDIGFWEYGSGHGVKTTDMNHAQAGTERPSRPNYMQQFFDTSKNKLLLCTDENPSAPVWRDAAGNVVS